LPFVKPIAALVLFASISSLTATVSAQSVSSDQDVVHQARRAYYNLARLGFSGFQATIEPNWEVTLGYAANPDNLTVFRDVRFSMNVDARGAVTLTHEVTGSQKTRVERYAKEIHNNVQRLVAGVFGTWAFFMIRSPFPESQIQILTLNKEYRLFYTEESTEVILTLTSDFLVAEAKLNGSTSRRTITPVFQKTSEGLLLTGYHTVSQPVGQGGKTTLYVKIEYEVVSGMKLPSKIHLKGMHGIEPIEAELRFNQYVPNPHR